MSAYISFLKLRFNVELQYRFAAIAGFLTQFFFGIMYIMLYDAFYRVGASTSMSWDEVSSYIWLNQAFFYLTSFNLIDSDIHDLIVTGQVSYEFIRPLNIYWFWYVKLFTKKIIGTLLRFFPVICISLILPYHFALKPPTSIIAFLLFAVALVLGVFLLISLSMVIYALMFYTTSSKGLFSVYAIFAEFFAGGVIPIPFMPEVMQKLCFILPFRLSVDLPYRIYCGNIPTQEAILSILAQLIWIIISVFIGLLLFKNSSKKLVVQGG